MNKKIKMENQLSRETDNSRSSWKLKSRMCKEICGIIAYGKQEEDAMVKK